MNGNVTYRITHAKILYAQILKLQDKIVLLYTKVFRPMWSKNPRSYT